MLANVLTEPFGVTLRIAWVKLSKTSTLPEASTVTPDG